MGERYDQLKARLLTITNLEHAAAILGWDQQTYMPPGGAEARASQLGTLASLAHTMFTAEETGRLLEQAAQEVEGLPFESDEASLVRVMRRDYEEAKRVPESLVAELSSHSVIANSVWIQARRENDYSLFAPYLQKTIELSRQVAEHLGYEDRLYDALLNQFEPGMKSAEVESIFSNLKEGLVPLVKAIAERSDRVDDSVLYRTYDEGRQESFGLMIAKRFGYDLSRGRQDRAVHPFCTHFSRNDVRITTRFEENFLGNALFSTMHETGHALYEQGVAESLEGTTLATAASLGVHESQSRLWENVVGRSLPFWQHFYPELQATFPEQLGDVDLDTFYGAVNCVQPSLIRTEADEVTYNLHIMLRFEMEQDLLEGRYGVEEAPEVWDRKMEEYLGVRPPNAAQGILQDMHWSGGMMGYFPTYSLGNILSLQLWDRAVADVPEIPEQIGRGEFDELRQWMTEHVYRHGRKFEPKDLIQRATGEPLQSRSYLRYLREKYGKIYGLSSDQAPVGVA